MLTMGPAKREELIMPNRVRVLKRITWADERKLDLVNRRLDTLVAAGIFCLLYR